MIPEDSHVAGFCPYGCGEKLYLCDGRILCRDIDCPNEEGLHRILMNTVAGHTINFQDDAYCGSYSVVHPLRERIDNELLTCCIEEEGINRGLRGTWYVDQYDNWTES